MLKYLAKFLDTSAYFLSVQLRATPQYEYHMILWHVINYQGTIFLPPPHSFEQGERPIIFQVNFLLFLLLIAFDFGWSPAITVVGGCFISSFRPPSRARGGSRSRRVGDKSLRRSDLEDREQRVVRTKTNRDSTPRDSHTRTRRFLPYKGESPLVEYPNYWWVSAT